MISSLSAQFRLGGVFALILSLLLMAPASSAMAPVDVGQANSHLKRAESNLQLVNGSIGHLKSPPKGSAGKLAAMRLAQALPDIQAAQKLLAKATGGAGYAEAKKRYDAADALYTRLKGILTGKPPAPKPDPTPQPQPGGTPPPKVTPPAKKTVRLGYPHADNFKSSLFTLRRVEGEATAFFAQQMKLREVADQLDVNFRTTGQARNGIKETRRQAGFVETGLRKIPSNGEGVAEAFQRLAKARADLDAASAYFDPLDKELQNLINPANYPNYPADLKRLKELSSMYSNPTLLFDQLRTQAISALTEATAAKTECIRIAKVYARLMTQETEQGKQIEIAGNGFLRSHEGFLKAAAERKASLPASIREDLAEANKYADEAVKEQKPMWFTGGIPQRLGWAADKLALYHALDPEGAPALQAEADAMIASLNKREDSLKELIIRENRMPKDEFAGADRDAAIAIAKDAWRIQEGEYELLAVRIPAQSWNRETKWTYSNGTWYFVDKSSLQVRLIVADKENPKQAIDRAINVRKDHTNGDRMIGVPLRSIDESLQPREYLLRENVK